MARPNARPNATRPNAAGPVRDASGPQGRSCVCCDMESGFDNRFPAALLYSLKGA